MNTSVTRTPSAALAALLAVGLAGCSAGRRPDVSPRVGGAATNAGERGAAGQMQTDTPAAGLARLRGDWRLVRIEEPLTPGDVPPPGETRQRTAVHGVTFTFDGRGRLTVRGPAGSLTTPYGPGEYAVTVDASVTPARLDLAPAPPGSGEPFRAIYRVDGHELRVCDFGDLPNPSVPPPDDFDLSMGIAYPKRVLVLRRASPAA